MNTPIAKDFYNYFRDCYKFDYKEFVVENILATKYKHKWFANGLEELTNGMMPYIPYSNTKLKELETELELYKLEKKLFYACYFVLGESNNPLIKDKRVCAPLLLFPANIEKSEDSVFLKIEKESFIVNRAILSKFDLVNESLTKDLFIKELGERLASHTDNAIWLKNLLDKYFCNQNSSDLAFYPNLWTSRKVKSHFTTEQIHQEEYTVVPAAGTVFTEMSSSSLRVLQDLEVLSASNEFNQSLNELLGSEVRKYPFGSSPFQSRLNPDQLSALNNAKQFTNSVIIGPPGTGKSYTISSIVADHVVDGKTVLVVSKTKQAVEVIREMLQNDFYLKDYIIHTTGNKYLISLKAKLRKYLSGIITQRARGTGFIEIEQLSDELRKLEAEFTNHIENELTRSELSFKDSLTLGDRLRKFMLSIVSKVDEEIWDIFSEINDVSIKLDARLRCYAIRKIEENIRISSTNYRADLVKYYDGLDLNSFSEFKQSLASINYENIISVFPIWLAHLSDLNSVLPLHKEIFDLVIIDESTQCDIASALPAIYRAKKVIIAGDPNQLKHYSFVSRYQQNSLQLKYQLPTDKMFDYRDRSILDLFVSKIQLQEQLTFLREHFRSTPSIIQFSNKHFYENQLEIIKSTPEFTSHSQIELIYVEDGKRNSDGVNRVEANSLINKFEEIIKDYKYTIEVPSVGIIAPFSSQVNYINSLVRRRFDLKTIKRFNLLCGTPYSFQGSEREIILLSFTVCKDTHHSAFIHLNKPEVMNVAITRAKSFQYVFTSIKEIDLKQESLFAEYLSFIKNYQHYDADEMIADGFQNEVVEVLKKYDLENIKCGYPVAGSVLDILVTHNGINYFIDLVGYPGQFIDSFSLERYKTLGRTGINCLPLQYSFWKKNKAKSITKLLAFMNVEKVI